MIWSCTHAGPIVRICCLPTWCRPTNTYSTRARTLVMRVLRPFWKALNLPRLALCAPLRPVDVRSAALCAPYPHSPYHTHLAQDVGFIQQVFKVIHIMHSSIYYRTVVHQFVAYISIRTHLVVEITLTVLPALSAWQAKSGTNRVPLSNAHPSIVSAHNRKCSEQSRHDLKPRPAIVQFQSACPVNNNRCLLRVGLQTKDCNRMRHAFAPFGRCSIIRLTA